MWVLCEALQEEPIPSNESLEVISPVDTVPEVEASQAEAPNGLCEGFEHFEPQGIVEVPEVAASQAGDVVPGAGGECFEVEAKALSISGAEDIAATLEVEASQAEAAVPGAGGKDFEHLQSEHTNTGPFADAELKGLEVATNESQMMGAQNSVDIIDIEDSPCKKELHDQVNVGEEHIGVSQVNVRPLSREDRRLLRQPTLRLGEAIPVDELHVEAMVASGFSREDALSALEACAGDPDLALEKLTDDYARDNTIQFLLIAGFGEAEAREAAKACDGDKDRAFEMLQREADEQQKNEELRQELIEQALQIDLGMDSQMDFGSWSIHDLQTLLSRRGSYMDALQTVPLGEVELEPPTHGVEETGLLSSFVEGLELACQETALPKVMAFASRLNLSCILLPTKDAKQDPADPCARMRLPKVVAFGIGEEYPAMEDILKDLDLEQKNEAQVPAYEAQGKPRGRKPKAKAKAVAKKKGKRSKRVEKGTKTKGSRKGKAKKVEKHAASAWEWWALEGGESEVGEWDDYPVEVQASVEESAGSSRRARKPKASSSKQRAKHEDGKQASKRRRTEKANAAVAEVKAGVAEVKETEVQFSIPEDCIPAPSHVSSNGVYSTAYRRAQALDLPAADCREAGKKASWLLRNHQKVSPSLSGNPRAARATKVPEVKA